MSEVTQNKKRRGTEGGCGYCPKPGRDIRGDRRFRRGISARALHRTPGPRQHSTNTHSSWGQKSRGLCAQVMWQVYPPASVQGHSLTTLAKGTHSLLQGWGGLGLDPASLRVLCSSGL